MAPGEFAHRQIHIAVRRLIVYFPVEIGGVAKRCNTPKIRGISAFRFRFIGLFTVGEGLDPPWDFTTENPIRRKANHNEIPPGNLRKSKIFAGRVKGVR